MYASSTSYFITLSLFVLCLFYFPFINNYFINIPFLSFLPIDNIFTGCWDHYSLLCGLMLLICGVTVLPFVFHYMGSFSKGWSLYSLVLFFIFVMGSLISSGDYLSTLIGWEYLGLVSYLLILFLCNLTSIRASLITLFASRFGDVALFFLVGLGCWGFSLSWSYSVLLMAVVFTKGAMFPLTSWLLEAMRAPTPVSCLVHSSTLVAAGVWFSFRYSYYFSDNSLELIGYFAVYTILLTGFSALFLTDLKKLVALSTCNNISWCMLCFSLGDPYAGLMFLFGHGVSKCLLFIVVGDLMSSSSGSQSGVGVYLSRYTGVFTPAVSVILLSSLCGLPFLGSFLSKHVLLDCSLLSHNSVFYYSCCLCVVLSFCYTYRFGYLMLNRCGGLSLGISSEYFLYLLVSFLPCLITYIGFGGSLEFSYSSSMYSVLSLFFLIHLFGLLLACLVFNLLATLQQSSRWSNSLGGCDYLVCLAYGLISYLSNKFYSVCYRWEVSSLVVFQSVFSGLSIPSAFSVNVCVGGLFWVLFIYFFIYF